MTLEVEKSHKKIKKANMEPLKRITVGILGTVMTISLYSGALTTKVYATDDVPTTQEETIEEVSIPEFLKSDISNKVGKQKEDVITKEDLKEITYLFIGRMIEADMSFLKECTNLESIFITVNDETNIDFIQMIPNLKRLNLTFMTDNTKCLEGIKKETLESLQLAGTLDTIELKKDNQTISENIKNNKLTLEGAKKIYTNIGATCK